MAAFATGGMDFLERLRCAEDRDTQRNRESAAGGRSFSINDGGFMAHASTKVVAPPGGKSSMSDIFGGHDYAEKQQHSRQRVHSSSPMSACVSHARHLM